MRTNDHSNGTIRVVDSGAVHVAESDRVDGEVTVDVSGDGGVLVDPVADGAGSVGSEDDVRDHSPPGGERPPVSTTVPRRALRPVHLLAVLPSVATLAGILAAVTYGAGIWVADGRILPADAVRLAHVTWVLLGVLGTAWMWYDAVTLAEDRREWEPDPLAYVGAGGVAFVAGGVGLSLATGTAGALDAPTLLALVVAGVGMSSTVTGPLYLSHRFRHIGGARAEGG